MACPFMRAMILAAGRGIRMGALTATTPKPLVELEGETLIDRQLRRLAAAGVARVVINLSYLGDRIRAAVGNGDRFGLEIRYSQEPDEPLETAGGIIQALPLLGDAPFWLTNADVVSDFDFRSLARRDGDGTLVLVPNPGHNPDGDYGLGDDSTVSTDPPKLTYSGMALLSPALFAGIAPGRRPLAEVLDCAIARRRLHGVVHDGLWIDVGTPERLALARETVRSKT